MYYKLKTELNWTLSDCGIVVYDGNKKLQFAINTEKNEVVFDFFKYLTCFRTETDIESYKLLNNIEKNDIINYCIEKGFVQEFEEPLTLTRMDSFLNSFPKVNFETFKIFRESTRIIIIGLGTVGSYTIDLLIKMGFKNFLIIDEDIVEEKNLYAQVYLPKDLGKYKVDVIKEKYLDFVNIISYPHYISTFKQFQNVTAENSFENLIINAADDYQLMRSLSKAFMEEQLTSPIIESGYGPLLQTAYLIDSCEAAKVFYDYINQILASNSQNSNIYENCGSVLNAYMSAFMIGQLILSPFVGQDFKCAEYHFIDNHLQWKKEIE
ncbi:ThiF family adenylyltransferase [Streptococcus penaeicida]|nr:ThiF family adenylyltransferase [Streptococcus penaeicida]